MKLYTNRQIHDTELEVERPLRRLAGALLVQAIQDVTSGPPTYVNQARGWLESKTKDGITFEMVCDVLNRKPEAVRENLYNRNILVRPNSPVEYNKLY